MMRLPEYRAGFADVRGARLYYEVAGAGPPLALIHAGGTDSRIWDAQFVALARRHTVIRYDARGHGQSTVPAGPFAFHDDLHDLLQTIGITRAALVGAMMGGGIAIDLALAHPEMVSALALIAPGVSGSRPSPALLRSWIEVEAAFQRGDRAGAIECAIRAWTDGPRRAADVVAPEVRSLMRRLYAENLPRQQHQGVARPLVPPAIGRLSAIVAPTLIMIGEEAEPTLLATSDTVASEIPGARKLIFPAVAHLVHLEAPDDFNRALLDFLCA